MINADIRTYNYFTIGDSNSYGQAQLPAENAEPEGTIKMAIYVTNQTVQDNINYKEASYLGLTHTKVDDTYIIEKEKERLKVLYVQPKGKYYQVFMSVL